MAKFNVLLEGPIGTGKSTACKTLIEAGLDLFILGTEPGVETIFGDTDESRCHWKYVAPSTTPWDTLISNAERTSLLSMEQLQKSAAINKYDYQQFLEVLRALSDFTCDRCGKNFGPVDDWDESRALSLDGLSGLSKMAMELTVGAKPIKTLPEWGVAQGNLMQLIHKLTGDLKCTFVLCAHMARERDELTGGTTLTVSTLGKAIAPEIPKTFDEVVFTKREGSKFTWSTTEANTDLKARKLPFADNLEPSFVQFFLERV